MTDTLNGTGWRIERFFASTWAPYAVVIEKVKKQAK
jgi:hypothetical protein